MPDAELLKSLKMAKGGKKMFFAFLPKGGSDGQLLLGKAKIPAKQIAETKKQLGGGNAITGKCFGGDGGVMVFQVAKDVAPALAAAVKKVVKRDAGLGIDPEFQLVSDADAEEPETDAGAVPAAPPVPPAAADAAAGEAADEAPLNLGPWKQARQDAIKDLKALAAKVASTKHGSAAGVLKEISYIMNRLPENPKANELDNLAKFIQTDETIAAAHEVPKHFHELDIRDSLLSALAAAKQ